MTTAEVYYILSLIDEPGWTDATAYGRPPSSIRLTRGDEVIALTLRFNGGDALYSVDEAPERHLEMLRVERLRPARRRQNPERFINPA